MSEAFPRLFSPTKPAGYTLNNRIAMAPLTRQMAEPDGTPTDEMAAYDARRARGGCGLIITEGTYEEDRLGCRAYLSPPGIANARHDRRWIMGSHIRWRSTIRTGRLAGERTPPMKTEFQRPRGRAETINEGERS